LRLFSGDGIINLIQHRRDRMTAAAQELLDAFEALNEADQREVVLAILRRASEAGDLPESALTEAADELFRALDAEEAARGQS
jgi:hypothetical protein